MSALVSLATAVPSFQHQQSDILQFMLQQYQFEQGEKGEKLSAFYQKSGISYRHSAVPDFSTDLQQTTLFNDSTTIPTVQERLKIYRQTALPLAANAINKCWLPAIQQKDISHLITVSCTGMSAPGLDIELMQQLELRPDIYRTSINFMGCYAAFHALKQANDICKAHPTAKVLVVCVELCTLHFQNETDMDNITATMLFADGAAAFIVCADDFAKQHKMRGLKMKSFYATVAFDGAKDMSWDISSTGFLMRLSAYIPRIIAKDIRPLLQQALANGQQEKEEINHWAIHPGGRKILEVIMAALQLESNALAASYKVLNNYGNMSSPTILFVLFELWQQHIEFPKKETIFAAGFGPGLTLETALLESF